ncbi:hypothetical protein ACOME3_005941 [Neoechinorhynchus agilis]
MLPPRIAKLRLNRISSTRFRIISVVSEADDPSILAFSLPHDCFDFPSPSSSAAQERMARLMTDPFSWITVHGADTFQPQAPKGRPGTHGPPPIETAKSENTQNRVILVVSRPYDCFDFPSQSSLVLRH